MSFVDTVNAHIARLWAAEITAAETRNADATKSHATHMRFFASIKSRLDTLDAALLDYRRGRD